MKGKKYEYFWKKQYLRGGGTFGLASAFHACKKNKKCYNGDVLHRKSFAFTLAEVLITLGIIGVVAAMTIPSLVTKYQKKVLETQFKKAYSVLLNANIMMREDYPSIYEDIMSSDSNVSDKFSEHLDRLIKYIPHSTMCTSHYLKCGGGNGKQYRNFPNTGNIHIDPDSLTTKSIMTNSGILIFMGPWGERGYHVDTNGPDKGPNRAGYDFFSFSIDKNNRVVPYSRIGGCEVPDNGAVYQGFTCAQYAVSNTCESDPSKTYWDCLP